MYARGPRTEATGSSGAFWFPILVKKAKNKQPYSCRAEQGSQQGTFPSGQRERLQTEEPALGSPASAASLSRTRFLYSIFLVLTAARLLRGGSDPASQGLACLPPSSKCALCPLSGPTLTTTSSISPEARRTPPPQPAQQVSSWPPPSEPPLPAAAPSGQGDCRARSEAALCHLAGGAVTTPPGSPAPVAGRDPHCAAWPLGRGSANPNPE